MVEYFSIVETGHCSVPRTNEQQIPFNFINRNSQELLVTIGDSWTWGDDITVSNNNEIRLKKVFGNVLSTILNSDWLNLGQCGSGNQWLAAKVRELSKIIPTLDYRRIYVVCTLTEVGRDFNSTYDRQTNYIDWLKTNDHTNLLEFLNSTVITEIINALTPFPHVVLKIGTNFVDHVGLETARPYLVDMPWINLITSVPDVCYIVGSYAIDNFKRSSDLFPDNMALLSWLNNLTDSASKRNIVLQDKHNFRNGHPLAAGHQHWAEYISQRL